MASSNVVLKSHIVNHLMADYRISESDANQIYDETYILYHELLTLIDLEPLQLKNEKILSSLTMMIIENIELNNDINTFYLNVVFYLVLFSKNYNIQYIFNNWLGFLCQQPNVSTGIKCLGFILEKINYYLNQTKFESFNCLNDILKSVRNNINLLQKKKSTCDDIQQIKEKFNNFISTNDITLSDESNPNSDDDDNY